MWELSRNFGALLVHEFCEGGSYLGQGVLFRRPPGVSPFLLGGASGGCYITVLDRSDGNQQLSLAASGARRILLLVGYCWDSNVHC